MCRVSCQFRNFHSSWSKHILYICGTFSKLLISSKAVAFLRSVLYSCNGRSLSSCSVQGVLSIFMNGEWRIWLVVWRYFSFCCVCLQDVVPSDLLEQYLSMMDPSCAQKVDSEITRHCAYSLPAVAYTLGRKNWSSLKNLYRTLATDVQVSFI